jgi:hypothetical protein
MQGVLVSRSIIIKSEALHKEKKSKERQLLLSKAIHPWDGPSVKATVFNAQQRLLLFPI